MPTVALRELTGEERTAYFRGVQPIWGGGLGEDRFVSFQQRLAACEECADRYRLLGLFDGSRMLSAMKAYDLRGSCAGAALRLLGIGAVYTPPPLRRRGHTREMLERALATARAQGCAASLLFSDIGAAYYERLGFRALESLECLVGLEDLPNASGSRLAIPGDEPRLVRLFKGADGSFQLDRDGWVLRFQIRRLRELARARGLGEPEWGLVVASRGGEACAMVRLARDTVDLLEAAWTSEGAREQLFGGLRQLLLRAGRRRLRFWPAHQLRGLHAEEPRTAALAMVASLTPGVELPPPGGRADLALLDHI